MADHYTGSDTAMLIALHKIVAVRRIFSDDPGNSMQVHPCPFGGIPFPQDRIPVFDPGY